MNPRKQYGLKGEGIDDKKYRKLEKQRINLNKTLTNLQRPKTKDSKKFTQFFNKQNQNQYTQAEKDENQNLIVRAVDLRGA